MFYSGHFHCFFQNQSQSIPQRNFPISYLDSSFLTALAFFDFKSDLSRVARFRTRETKTLGYLVWNLRESFVSSSLRSKERRLEVRECQFVFPPTFPPYLRTRGVGGTISDRSKAFASKLRGSIEDQPATAKRANMAAERVEETEPSPEDIPVEEPSLSEL